MKRSYTKILNWLSARPEKWLANALLALLYIYRHTLSPVFYALGYNCRFSPSCSQYASEAIRVHGPFRGGWMTAKRLGRCHPWCEGGIDPVVPAQMRYKGAKKAF